MPTLMLDGNGSLESRRLKGTNTALVPTLLIKGFPRDLESPKDQHEVFVFSLHMNKD